MFSLGFPEKNQKEKNWLFFSPLVAHRSIADEGTPGFLLN
jgi:hypothetical protein